MKARTRSGRAAPAAAAAWTADEIELARLAHAVAHPLRLRILRRLRQRGECVCGALVDELPRAQSTVSQHLKVLKAAGLVQGELEAPRVCYCVDDAVLRRLKRLIEDL